MQAIIQTRYGAANVLQLVSRPRPVPTDTEILVRVVASSVTAADSMMRQGVPRYGRLFLGLFKPRHPIPGTGFSGVVESTGAAVTRFAVGDEVMGESVLSTGSHCQYICIAEDEALIHKPTTISHAEAAPVCDGAMTSWNFLYRLGNIRAGQKVLINGAAGSLGSTAVQLAKLAGATVTGVCSSGNIDFVRSLGADDVIDYSTSDPLRKQQAFDLIFDSVGKFDLSRALSALHNGGSYLSPVLGLPLLLRMLFSRLSPRRRVLFSATGLLPVEARLAMLKSLHPLLEDGRLRIHVDRQYPLAAIADAHIHVDTGHKRGNIVVTP